MVVTQANWQAAFELWLVPFLARLRRAEQRHWAPVYLQGLLGPGERYSTRRQHEPEPGVIVTRVK